MKVEFSNVFVRASGRMSNTLFAPFSLANWLILSFTCWLAYMSEGFGGGADGSQIIFQLIALVTGRTTPTVRPRPNVPYRSFQSLADGLSVQKLPPSFVEKFRDVTGITISETLIVWIFVAIITIALLFIVIQLILAWIKARGEFMFLENIIHENNHVVRPWKENRSLGNSVFITRLALTLISFLISIVILGAIIAVCYPWVNTMIQQKKFIWPSGGLITGVIVLFLFLTASSLFLGFLHIVLKHFVIPVMFIKRLPVLSAFRVAFRLMKECLLEFILYFLIIFIINFFMVIIVYVAATIVSIFTCGISNLFFNYIPYIWVVIFLPYLMFMRHFTLEFLAQVREDLDCFYIEESSTEVPADAATEGAVPEVTG